MLFNYLLVASPFCLHSLQIETHYPAVYYTIGLGIMLLDSFILYRFLKLLPSVNNTVTFGLNERTKFASGLYCSMTIPNCVCTSIIKGIGKTILDA